MAVPLLERDAFLHTLDYLLGQVDEEGQGRIALLSGGADQAGGALSGGGGPAGL
jgi:hypothetical protein